MPIDPYAALQALLRAEAVRTAPPQAAPAQPAPSPEQTTRETDPTEPERRPKDA
ncbi:hypothetical protein ABZS76_25970 [Streptomyces sp. NPDC005562]|uniref:hypothetical protein n=1 Tax=Streptomyces sp. NPDC005562 TaxID=3154890 RepID=UPI0033A2406A